MLLNTQFYRDLTDEAFLWVITQFASRFALCLPELFLSHFKGFFNWSHLSKSIIMYYYERLKDGFKIIENAYFVGLQAAWAKMCF